MREPAVILCLGAALLYGPMVRPVTAQTVQPPPGCTAYLTVQMKGCNVSTYWRCDSGPVGASWEANYDAGGPVSLSLYDRDFQWIDSQYVATATREFLLTPAKDPASLSDLLTNGRDTYDFVIREEGPEGTRDVRHQGFDELAGTTTVIDGEELEVTLFNSTASDAETGEPIYSVTGLQYILANERLFFLGSDTFERDGRETTSDNGPVKFFRPGDAGFGLTTPQYECGEPTDISFEPRAAGAMGQ